MLYLGSLFYISLMLINAMAILNEERFLARSTSRFEHVPLLVEIHLENSLSWLDYPVAAAGSSQCVPAAIRPLHRNGTGAAGHQRKGEAREFNRSSENAHER